MQQEKNINNKKNVKEQTKFISTKDKSSIF
jgi:hypothetical protein